MTAKKEQGHKAYITFSIADHKVLLRIAKERRTDMAGLIRSHVSLTLIDPWLAQQKQDTEA